MGGIIGHAIAGTMFLITSIWWFIGEILNKSRKGETLRSKGKHKGKPRSKRIQHVWYSCPGPRLSKTPLEPMLKVIFAVIGILAELPLSNSATLFDENGEVVTKNLRNHGHAMMYGFFGLSGIVDLVMWYNLLPLPRKFDYLVLSLAFCMEGLLFFFHLDGRSQLNVRIHTILYMVAFLTAAVLFLVVLSDQFIPYLGFVGAYLLSLQGTWFIQVGFVIRDSLTQWKNTPGNVELSGILFALHSLVLFIVHLSARIICYRYFGKKDPQLSERLLENCFGEEAECNAIEFDP